MKSKIIKWGLNIVAGMAMICGSMGFASADTWQYGDLNRLIASSSENSQWETYREVGLSVDDTNIHIHVSMDPDKYASNDSTFNTGDSVIQLSGYVLTIAGQTIYIDSHEYVGDLQGSKVNQTKTYSVNAYNPSKGNAYIQNAITVTHQVRDNGNRMNNIIEITLPLKELGIELPATSKATLTNSNIWKGEVSVTVDGASSGPWVIVVIGLVIAALGAFKLKNKFPLHKKGQEQYA